MALHTIKTGTFSENPDKWGRELNECIELEIYLMQTYLQGIDNDNFKPEGEQDFAGIPRLQNISQEERKKRMKETTINNTFLSIFRSLVVYLDKTLSLYLLTKRTQDNPIPVEKIGDFETFFDDLVQGEYKGFAMDKKNNFPEKMSLLPTLNTRSKERLEGYNKLRVAFEHHGGIAKNEITFPIATIERQGESADLQKATIRLDIVEQKTFKKNEIIKFKPQDVTLISLDIRGWIIKDVLLSIDELTKTKQS